MNLEQSRKAIDEIDQQLVKLFTERMACAAEIAAYKKENNTSAYVYYYNEDINEYKEEVQKRKESASKYATTNYKEPTELEIYNKFRINISSYQDYLDNADTEYILE